MNNSEEILSLMALTRVHGLGLAHARKIVERVGSAADIMQYRKSIRDIIPDASTRLVNALADSSVNECIERAKTEIEFMNKHNIRAIGINDYNYPQRLKECDDSPLVLFFIGSLLPQTIEYEIPGESPLTAGEQQPDDNINHFTSERTFDLSGKGFNRKKVISIVGTRHCSEYGKDICRNLIRELSEMYPDIIIVSGLAYGVDICAHREALNYGMDTIGVLAHGLDMIYPALHRQTAYKMISQGGLLTEYMSNTNPDKGNFVRRNRIVAGMCDATVVVESADKGGSLITASIAQSYNRDVLAFPGRVNDQYSIGCNKLIRNNVATLIQNADDLLDALCWENPKDKATAKPKQLSLFEDYTDEERQIGRAHV